MARPAGRALTAVCVLAVALAAHAAAPEAASAAGEGGARLRVSKVPLTPDSARPPVVSWSTGERGAGVVTVTSPGNRETLFGSGSDGSATAPWLSTESEYTFRLYEGSTAGRLLARLTVAKNTSYEVASAYDPTPGWANRLLQVLSFVAPLALAGLAVAWGREVVRDG